MTATLDDVAKKKAAAQTAEQQAAVELVRLARERGLSLTGPDGLLKQLTKTVIETALNEEMTDHLGYEKHDPAGAGTGNIRNGTRAKTVLTEASGHVEVEVPRDRAGTFEPQIVKKRQRRLNGVDEIVLSLYAKSDVGCRAHDLVESRCLRVRSDGDVPGAPRRHTRRYSIETRPSWGDSDATGGSCVRGVTEAGRAGI
jgi:Transposase, Mutator family